MDRPRRRRGCCGCLTVILVLVLVVVGWMALVRLGLLEKLGLRHSMAEQVFADPPDRAASGAVMGMLQQAGVNMQGVDVLVLPMTGHEGSVALIRLDASRGFDPQRLLSELGHGDSASDVLDEAALRELNVTRLALDYVNKEGKSIVTLTAPVDALAYTGQGDADAQELIKSVMGRIDIPGLVKELTP